MWLLPAALFITYITAALILMAAQNAELIPHVLEPVFSLLVSPMHFLFRPIYPLLRLLGMLEGEYWVLPSPSGFVLGATLYAGVLIVIGHTVLSNRH